MEKKILMLSSANYMVSTRFTRLARILSQNGYDVNILCCDRTHSFLDSTRLKGIKINFIKTYISKLRLNYILMPIFLLILYIKIFFKCNKNRSYDIIYSYTFDMLPIGIILKKTLSCKLIYDSAEYYPGMIENLVPPSIYFVIRALYYKLAKQADYVLTTNTWTKFQFELVNIKTVSVISNVPDTNIFRFKPEIRKSIRRNLEIDNDTVLFSFIGFLAKNRGLEEIIKACKLLSKKTDKFKILIIGRGPLLNFLKNAIRSNDLAKFFIIKSFIDLENVPNYLSSSDCVIILYKKDKLNNWYAVPNKLFEAVACQRPVIGSNFGYLKKLILEMECGLLVNPDDVEDIADKMEILIKKTDYRKELGRKGIRQIYNKYNLNNYSNILIKIIKKLI